MREHMRDGTAHIIVFVCRSEKAGLRDEVRIPPDPWTDISCMCPPACSLVNVMLAVPLYLTALSSVFLCMK